MLTVTAVSTVVVASSKASHDLPAEAEAEAYAGNIEYVLGKPGLGYSLTSHALSLAHDLGVAPAVRVEIEDIYASRREGSGYQSDQNLAILKDAAEESRRRHLPERGCGSDQPAGTDVGTTSATGRSGIAVPASSRRV
jgi:hypothetical protein